MAVHSPRRSGTVASTSPTQTDIARTDGSDFTIAEALRLQAKQRPDCCVESFARRRTTYGQLDERSSKIARALHSEGLQRGDCVAHLGGNTEEYLALFFGCAKAGVIVVPVDPERTPHTVASILKECEAKVLFVEREFADCATKIERDLPQIRRIVAMDCNRPAWPRFAQWYGIRSADNPRTPLRRADRVLQLYPPSPTGRPKATPLTHHDLMVAGYSTYFEPRGKAKP